MPDVRGAAVGGESFINHFLSKNDWLSVLPQKESPKDRQAPKIDRKKNNMIIKDNNNERSILDFEARKKFYEKELESGDIIEYNGAFYKKGSSENSLEVCLPLNSEISSNEALEKIRKTTLPENAVTVVGKNR